MISTEGQGSPYQLIRRIAIGGMGEVFLARDQSHSGSQDFVVLKRILPELMTERQFIDRFVDEARIMMRFDHPNLLTLYQLRQDEWGLYMVMEFVDGVDLRTLNKRLQACGETWPRRVAVWLIKQVCDGLSYAHHLCDEEGEALKLIHRDVSPSNILLDIDRKVKLIDFGVARSEIDTHRSITGSLHGKLAYMSPEQARGDEVTVKSDLFALGVTLYELLVGDRPRDGESDAELLKVAQEELSLQFDRVSPPIDDELIAIMSKALSLHPEHRWDDAHSFSQALGDWLSVEDTQIEQEVDEWLATHEELLTNSVAGLSDALKLQVSASSLMPHSGEVTVTLSPRQETISLVEDRVSQPFVESSGILASREQSSFIELLSSVSGGELSALPRIDEVVSQEAPSSLSTSSNLGKTKIGNPRLSLGKGVSLGVVCTLLIFTLWWTNQSTERGLQLEVVTEELEGVSQHIDTADLNRGEITVDGVPWSLRSTYPVDVPMEVCIHPSGWRRTCEWIRLEDLPIGLQSTPTSNGKAVQVPFAQLRLTVRKASISTRKSSVLSPKRDFMETGSGQETKSSIMPSQPEGSAQHQSKKLTSVDRKRRATPDSRKPTTQISKKSDRRLTARTVEVTSQVELTLICSSSGHATQKWMIGPKIPRNLVIGQKCKAEATGYVSETFIVDEKHSKLSLRPQGYLTVRVSPPAATLQLDGRTITNPSQQLLIKGAQHKLTAHVVMNGVAHKESWPIVIGPNEHARKFFEVKLDPQARPR